MHLDLLRDESATFPSAAIPSGLNSLCVWHCKYKTLRPIAELRQLRALKIATFPDDTLEFLSELKALEWLSITHLPKITSLRPIGSMSALRWLELATLPSWDSSKKRTVVDSLGPLVNLPALQHVSLLGVVPESRSLQDLVKMPALRTARLHGFGKEVVASFFAESAVQNEHIPDHELQT